MRPRTQTLIIGFLIILLVCGHLIKPATNYLMLPIGRILAFGGSAYVGLTVNPVIGMLMALVCLQAMSDFYVIEHLTPQEREIVSRVQSQANTQIQSMQQRVLAPVEAVRTTIQSQTQSPDEFNAQLNAMTGENLASMEVAASYARCTCPSGYPTFLPDKDLCENEEGKTVKPSMCTCSSGYAYDIVSGTCKQNSVMSSPIPATTPPPEGSIPVVPEPTPRPPPISSVRPMPIPLTESEKALYFPTLSTEPAPAEESS